MGDPSGIGPEIVARAMSDPAVVTRGRFTVFGHRATMEREPCWAAVRATGQVELVEPSGMPDHAVPAGRPTAESGRIALACIEAAIADAKRGAPGGAPALVTAPISKEACQMAGCTHPGHTELLADRFQSPRSGMLIVGPVLRVILATIHIPLREVPRALTTQGILDKVQLGHAACLALGVASPRIAVAGLNPHAGEHGLFGDEDDRVIAPAVAEARSHGIDVTGPLPGDTVFLSAVKGRFDLVVAMYHDQGLIPVKIIDRAEAVNVTVGLAWQGRPFIRTSPAHGTAYDIAGTGAADPTSMKAAIRLAVRMCARRA